MRTPHLCLFDGPSERVVDNSGASDDDAVWVEMRLPILGAIEGYEAPTDHRSDWDGDIGYVQKSGRNRRCHPKHCA